MREGRSLGSEEDGFANAASPGRGMPFGRDFTFEVALMFGMNVPFTSTHQTSIGALMPMPVPASKLACL